MTIPKWVKTMSIYLVVVVLGNTLSIDAVLVIAVMFIAEKAVIATAVKAEAFDAQT